MLAAWEIESSREFLAANPGATAEINSESHLRERREDGAPAKANSRALCSRGGAHYQEDSVSKARCVALVHSRAHEDLWTPCVRPPQAGGLLCREHRDALDGVLLGLESSEVVPQDQPAAYRYILAGPGSAAQGRGGGAKAFASHSAGGRPHPTRSIASAQGATKSRTR